MTDLLGLLEPSGLPSYLTFPAEKRKISLIDLWKRGRNIGNIPAVVNLEPIGAVLTNSSASVSFILGMVQAGATLVSLPGPARGVPSDWYSTFVTRVCALTGVRTLVVDNEYRGLLALPGYTVCSFGEVLALPGRGKESAGFRIVQFTSGSTSEPRGILISGKAVAANVMAILDRLQPTRGDQPCSWLPLSHDMGLIGMFLSSVAGSGKDWANGLNFTLLTPEMFLRAPQVWMQTCSAQGVTITAGPPFGLEMAMRRAGDEKLDLKRLRICIVGGEPIPATTLEKFSSHFEASGFRDTAFCPAYGMAEATLAVTLTDPAEMWATSMGPEPMADGKRPVKRRRVVGVGRPVRNMEISVGSVDGEIKIKGPSLMEGYVGKAPWVVGKSEWFPTKDTGFLEGENLFVLGRTDEVCFVAGRNIHLRDIEESLHRLAGLRAGRVAVAKVSEGEYGIVAEVEDLEISKDATKTLANDVRRVALGRTNKAPIWVALIPRGTLPITTSGKPRPAEAVAALRSGKLDPLPGSLAESWV